MLKKAALGHNVDCDTSCCPFIPLGDAVDGIVIHTRTFAPTTANIF
ncbi:MAG: hypothetical protein H6820_12525 [Phycisphaerales bacterium]|nr:hypothetical protein [Phycisphaerales bacterium]